MGIDLLDVAFRLERRFGVKISRDQILEMVMRNEPPDLMVGDLFDFIRHEIPQSRVLDLDLDATALWPMLQRGSPTAWASTLRWSRRKKGSFTISELSSAWNA